MKKLIKEKNNILTDMLEGIALTNDNIEIISETVVVKKNKKNSGVALVSGGGSGHEPAHAVCLMRQYVVKFLHLRLQIKF